MEPSNHWAITSAIVNQARNDGGFSLPFKISIPYLPLRFSQRIDTPAPLFWGFNPIDTKGDVGLNPNAYSMRAENQFMG